MRRVLGMFFRGRKKKKKGTEGAHNEDKSSSNSATNVSDLSNSAITGGSQKPSSQQQLYPPASPRNEASENKVKLTSPKALKKSMLESKARADSEARTTVKPNISSQDSTADKGRFAAVSHIQSEEDMTKEVVEKQLKDAATELLGSAKSSKSTPDSKERGPPKTQEKSSVNLRFVTSPEKFTEDAPHVVKAYDAVPVLEQTKLPRGGVSIETKAVGRVQYGIPPETIKDSMRLGIPVPQVYIVPVERFCREMGPALGVNLAEFEFPAYFNFFVYKKRCTLVVDSEDAEENICRVFSETLLGPGQFRNEDPIPYEDEDFDPDFPREARPNFAKELQYFRVMPDGNELVLETLLSFRHFEMRSDGHDNLGVPPIADDDYVLGALGDELPKHQHLAEVNCKEDDYDDKTEALPVPKNEKELERREKQTPWTYSQAKFMGDIATVWPFNATEEQIKNRTCPRVEIFKMPGGTEYIIHDVDQDNKIIGKARIAGHVKVSEAMSVDGFGGHDFIQDVMVSPNMHSTTSLLSESSKELLTPKKKCEIIPPPTFHPPSFGVTVLGNSHGFDKSGSVSGYVLWINGRGVMIDPPPYSSATLEREGIRPRTVVGIILTHCHADHDAGAFQKVLTGSPVVVITTPTIYKSFIRKYAALTALSPALLRHSHRYKPCFIGQPLRFQGATFHFTYTLHTIPCVGFRVEWRGRSMVFTGDHFNKPSAIDMLQETGVLTKARADDLRNLPLQETDVLLHEAGAPPIHTPLEELLKLPVRVKKRLYVVHTSALPEGCELKVAPTGTKGTIRLDKALVNRQMESILHSVSREQVTMGEDEFVWSGISEYETIEERGESSEGFEDDFQGSGELDEEETYVQTRSSHGTRGHSKNYFASSFAHRSSQADSRSHLRMNLLVSREQNMPPLVSLRPASSTDAWYILNLLSAVPFMSSLSYASTMEVLETAKVDAYSDKDIIVPADRRSRVLCVVWEGTCTERSVTNLKDLEAQDDAEQAAVWHAGDWTGPLSLQPEKRLSGESVNSENHDIVAVSSEGVKVITIEFKSLHFILKTGSPLYRKFLERKAYQERIKSEQSKQDPEQRSTATDQLLDDALKDLNVLELLNNNSALRKLSAVQKRHLECLAEGPTVFQPGERLWRAGAPVDRAYLLISGTASFVQKRRNAGSSSANAIKDQDKFGDPSVGDSMRVDAIKAMKELGVTPTELNGEESSMSSQEMEELKGQIHFDTLFSRFAHAEASQYSDAHDFDKLSRGLQKRAEFLQKEESVVSENDSHDDTDSLEIEIESQLDYTFTDDADPGNRSRRSSVIRRRSSRARFANKVLGRFYSRRAFIGGLVFSRGHFLGDVSKMVAGLLSTDALSEVRDDNAPNYGFGNRLEGSAEHLLSSVAELVIHEQEGDHYIMHSSTLTAGRDGCVVLIFPKSSLIPFLDAYPGLLLSLLGTQVVV